MDGRGSPLITADKLNSLEVCGCVAPLKPQLCMFKCVDNCIMLVCTLKGKCYELAKDDIHSPASVSVSPILPFLFIVTHGY